MVVALVQADAGFVQDIQHARQLRPDLCGQADALRLAARKRCRRTVHVEVVDADVQEEMHALVDFAQDFLGYIVLSFSEFDWQFVNPFSEAERVHVGHLGDVFPVDAEPLRLLSQSRAAANGTGYMVHERARPARDGRRSLLVVLLLDEVDDALEVDFERRGDAERFALHLESLVGTVENHVQGLVGEVLQRRV